VSQVTQKVLPFFEYLDPGITDRACSGLNGMKLGEKTVLVQRANIGAKHQMPNPNATSILTNATALNLINLGMPIAAACALLGININDPGPPTRIVQLCNLVSPDDIQHDADYEDIFEDVTQESRKYGTVLSVYIPRPPPRSDEERTQVIWGLGRIFVEYKRKEEASKAQQGFSGRKFNGRTIVTGFLTEERFAARDLTPNVQEEAEVAEKFLQIQLLNREQEENDENAEYYQ